MTSLSHTDYSMRSAIDKEIEAIDLDQLFSQYVETDLFQQYSDATTGPSSSEDLSYLFEEPSSNGSDQCDTSTLPNWGTSNERVAWHKAIRRHEEQDVASPLIGNDFSSVYPHSGGKASSSDPILCSFDDLFELDDFEPRAVVSQPSTPTLQTARPTRKARSSPGRTIRQGANKNHNKSGSASSVVGKMMRPSTFRAGHQDIWTRKVDTATEAFNLHTPPNNGIQSPPVSAKFTQEGHSNNFFPREPQPYTIAMSPLPGDTVSSPGIQSANYQLTPLSSPAIDINSGNSMANPFQFSNDGMTGGYISSAALSALQTPPPSNRLPMTTWTSNTSPTVDLTSFSSSPDFQAPTKTIGWWNAPGPASSLPVAQPSATSAYRGLGISCDTASFSSFGSGLGGNQQPSFDMSPYYPSTRGISIGHGPANPPSRSPSPSPQPRLTRRRHSSQNHTHHRNPTSSRRKSSNSSQHARGASLGGGFVNFTPDDSRKILTGVAPSGSSKTKARREKEAAEKRRKLSQAALKAVMEAGGDIARLEKEGFLALEG